MKLEIVARQVDEVSTWLLRHRANITSECGEDGILAKVFDVIGQHGKVCVEFGAWDGMKCSNTHALIEQQGWSGYLIEANNQYQPLIGAKLNFENFQVLPPHLRVYSGAQG